MQACILCSGREGQGGPGLLGVVFTFRCGPKTKEKAQPFKRLPHPPSSGCVGCFALGIVVWVDLGSANPFPTSTPNVFAFSAGVCGTHIHCPESPRAIWLHFALQSSSHQGPGRLGQERRTTCHCLQEAVMAAVLHLGTKSHSCPFILRPPPMVNPCKRSSGTPAWGGEEAFWRFGMHLQPGLDSGQGVVVSRCHRSALIAWCMRGYPPHLAPFQHGGMSWPSRSS